MTKEKFNKLLYRLQKGEGAALKPIYDEYFRTMTCAAFFVLHNQNDAVKAATDAVTEIYKYAQSNKNKTLRISDPGAFLYEITTACATAALKRLADEAGSQVGGEFDFTGITGDSYELIKAISEMSDTDRELSVRYFLFGEKKKHLEKVFDGRCGNVEQRIEELRGLLSAKV